MSAPAVGTAPAPTAAPAAPGHAIIPAPVSVQLTPADSFTLTPALTIVVAPGDAEASRVARQLARLIGISGNTAENARTTGGAPPRVVEAAGAVPRGSIGLRLDAGNAALGDEGYELTVTPERVTIAARTPAGLFYGVQTLRQMLPPAVEYSAALPRGAMKVPAGRIADQPRFAWRGAMLDVGRHFLQVDEVKRYIDLMALYKLNRLHLHLSEDQGWRVEIRSWPRLTQHGASTQVGGGPGGFYTQAEYADLVRYAQERYITVVPEIDMPGHTNAALASYPELNCDGVAPPLYTGINVGFSTLCVDKEVTYRFVDDVVRELAALTPGEFFHIGGDEVEKLTPAEYQRFVERVTGIVQKHGKRVVGWEEIAAAKLAPSAVLQYWRVDSAHLAQGLAHGAKMVLSPASRIYIDMKYDSSTVLGLNWAGNVSVRAAYDWDPTMVRRPIPESAILGVEAPMWSETLATLADFEYLAFPRLAGAAEIGWSPRASRSWDEYRVRLGRHGPRWTALGVNFYRAPGIPWQE